MWERQLPVRQKYRVRFQEALRRIKTMLKSLKKLGAGLSILAILFSPVVASADIVRTLVIAGGGAGNTSGQGAVGGGAGGAGGYLHDAALSIPAGTYNVTVGGAGSNSVFHTMTAIGGGGGGYGGGAGGGGGSGGSSNGAGTAGQGNNGGASNGGSGTNGGGGGAGAVGEGGQSNRGGNGGGGTANDISGSLITYACGGGGGGNNSYVGGSGGCSSAGNGGDWTTAATSGTANRGGGGGGRNSAGSGGSGGSGIVITRFTTGSVSFSQTGGTETTVGGDTVITWLANGTFTVSGGASSIESDLILFGDW